MNANASAGPIREAYAIKIQNAGSYFKKPESMLQKTQAFAIINAGSETSIAIDFAYAFGS